jgi:hypothetical protein
MHNPTRGPISYPCGSQELLSGHLSLALGYRDQRRQRNRANMQDAAAMDVIELEALHLGAVDECGVR